MANSLESDAEEDEKKKMKYSSSAPNKSQHVNSASKNHNTPWNSGALHSQKQRCLSMESDNVSNAGFLYGA